MRELIKIRGGRAIVSSDTIYPCRPDVRTMKAMHLNEDFPALPVKDFQNHCILVFDLTSLQDAAEQLHYLELNGESLRLEMFFQFSLEPVTEVIILRERTANVHNNNLRTIATNIYFFEFSGSYKTIVAFYGLFFVFVSVISILCFFRPKFPEKK